MYEHVKTGCKHIPPSEQPLQFQSGYFLIKSHMLNSAISSGLRNETALSAERMDVRPQNSGYWTRTAALLAAFGWDV